MSTLLFKTMRIARFNVNKAAACVKHDLLLDTVEKIRVQRIPEKSYLNTYTYRGKIITDVDERNAALDEIKRLAFGTINELAPSFDSKLYSKKKYKIKKFAGDEKLTEVERDFFSKLSLLVEQKDAPLDAPVLVDELMAMGKIKRFNDKKKLIESISELHNQRRELNVDSSSKFATGIETVIFKVPGTNEQKLSGAELEAIINRYYRETFPDYPVLLSVVHRDEDIEHAHLTVHAQNQKTLEYDFVQHQYELVRDEIKGMDMPERYSDIRGKGADAKLRAVGEALQARVYEFTNRQPEVLAKKVTFKQKEYVDAEHKRREREVIKLDTSKRIADREFNTANYLSKLKHQRERELEQVRKKLTSANDELEQTERYLIVAQDERDAAIREANVLAEQNQYLRETVICNAKKADVAEKRAAAAEQSLEAFKSLIKEAVIYAKQATAEALLNIKSHFTTLNKTSKTLAKEAHNNAVQQQPTDKQKRDIDDAYYESFKP